MTWAMWGIVLLILTFVIACMAMNRGTRVQDDLAREAETFENAFNALRANLNDRNRDQDTIRATLNDLFEEVKAIDGLKRASNAFAEAIEKLQAEAGQLATHESRLNNAEASAEIHNGLFKATAEQLEAIVKEISRLNEGFGAASKSVLTHDRDIKDLQYAIRSKFEGYPAYLQLQIAESYRSMAHAIEQAAHAKAEAEDDEPEPANPGDFQS